MLNSNIENEIQNIKINKMISLNNKIFFFISNSAIDNNNNSENNLINDIPDCNKIHINKV